MFGTITASVSDPDLPDPEAKKMTKMTTGIFFTLILISNFAKCFSTRGSTVPYVTKKFTFDK